MNGFEVKDRGPGYLSLAIVELRDNQDLAREIRERFSPIRGIHQVEIDQAEGVLTVSFSHQQLTSFPSLLTLKGAFSTIFPEVNVWELASLLRENLKAE